MGVFGVGREGRDGAPPPLVNGSVTGYTLGKGPCNRGVVAAPSDPLFRLHLLAPRQAHLPEGGVGDVRTRVVQFHGEEVDKVLSGGDARGRERVLRLVAGRAGSAQRLRGGGFDEVEDVRSEQELGEPLPLGPGGRVRVVDETEGLA